MMKIPSAKPYVPKEDQKFIVEGTKKILASGMFISGEFTKQFEDEFAKYVGTKHALTLNSATSGLQALLTYFNVAGKEVITPANTFIATSNAVLYAGGKPVLADIHADTLCMDPKQVEKKITSRTKGIILVHLAGYISPHTREIQKIAKRHKLFLIEDASHAHGSSMGAIKAGALGDAAVFSSLATKVMTTGGVGGIVSTNNPKIYDLVKSLRFHGEDKQRGIQNRLGNNWLMTEWQALVGLTQLRRLDEIVAKRMAIAHAYDEVFSKIPQLTIYQNPPKQKNGYYKYPVLLSKSLSREEVSAQLKELGIAAGTSYWPPSHLQPIYTKMFKYTKKDFPVASEILNRTISLPLYTGMTKKEVHYVIDGVKKVCSA